LSQTDARDSPTHRIYVDIRGEFMMNSLRTLAAASVSTTKKRTPDAIYKPKDNAIGTYAQGMEGLFVAEYENICPVFSREDWGMVYTATCQASLGEFNKTLRELNGFIQKNLTTDCFLGYEIIDIVTKLSMRLESKTGELKRPIYDTMKPIRETSKASLGKLIEDSRTRVQTLVALPMDGASVPVTTETMTRLQNMANYLGPLSSVLTSLGDGGWKDNPAAASSNSISTMDVGADGIKLFAHYVSDTIDALLEALKRRASLLLKGRGLQGVFLANNVAIIDRLIRTSELQPILVGYSSKLESWRKQGIASYLEAWREPSGHLLDVQYTNRSGRPHSGSAAPADSAAVVKGLSSKDKDAIKEKFKKFNDCFDGLVSQHKSYKMEREVRIQLAREVQTIIEPLYGRFWDRYHEIDKGKGKYVKYDKGQLGSIMAGLA
jgi:exocyst complex protein 7